MEKVMKEVFEAEDGTIFFNEEECIEHEMLHIIEGLEVKDKKIRNTIPINDFFGNCCSEPVYYTWYELKDIKDYDNLKWLFPYIKNPGPFPTLICVERYKENNEYRFSYTIDDCYLHTERFWKKFGKKVSFSDIRRKK